MTTDQIDIPVPLEPVKAVKKPRAKRPVKPSTKVRATKATRKAALAQRQGSLPLVADEGNKPVSVRAERRRNE